jgi:hypothetical protein
MRCNDVDAAAWRIISLLDGLALQSVAHADLVPLEDANRWAREYAERELGLAPEALDSAIATGRERPVRSFPPRVLAWEG